MQKKEGDVKILAAARTKMDFAAEINVKSTISER